MKKIIVILITMFIIVGSASVTYADDTLPDFDDYLKSDDGVDKYYYVYVYGANSDPENVEYTLVVSHSSDNPVQPNMTQSNGCYVNNGQGVNAPTFSKYSWKPSEGSNIWTHVSSGKGFIHVGCPPNSYGTSTSLDIVYMYSNYDIMYQNQVVFQKAHTLGAILIPRAQMMDLILSSMVFLIPSLIVLVVLVIGFRKGWTFLKVQLLG